MGGGNNRARTCDPMLVRHVLSQLSYAPVVLFCGPRCRVSQAAKLIIAKTPPFVKGFFPIFYFSFFGSFRPGGKEARNPWGTRVSLPFPSSRSLCRWASFPGCDGKKSSFFRRGTLPLGQKIFLPNYKFFSRSSSSSFSKTWTASQNWQVISARPCSAMRLLSSSRPMLARAERIRSRLQ